MKVKGYEIKPYAYLCGANLRGSYLRGANLSDSNLCGANLSGSDLRSSDLGGSNLRKANLGGSDLRGSDLRDSNLSGSNLRGSNLSGSDLRGSDLDFSCWPLWCGSKDVIVDRSIFLQLLAHICAVKVDDDECLEAQKALVDLAKQSHRAQDLGL